jgi:ABC-type nitrate/sulfonate/bicarbonate transport system ATPase subunit
MADAGRPDEPMDATRAFSHQRFGPAARKPRFRPTTVTSGSRTCRRPDATDEVGGTHTPVPASPTLEVRHLTATYDEGGRRLTALSNLTFDIGDGEFVSLIGPSGSGKSTLLDVIAGLTAVDQGEIALGGETLTTAERLGRTAYMRQRDLLLPWRTAAENAGLALEVRGMPRKSAIARARARFPEFGLGGFADAYPGQLSGGMRQRVAFLRTVLANQSLLLLDEPFGALDALTRAEMQEWLLGLWHREQSAVLLVTHDVDEAIFLGDRVIVFTPRPGQIAHEEPVSLPRPRHRSMVTDAAFVQHKAVILAALGLVDQGSA